jgi:hypothetical protein
MCLTMVQIKNSVHLCLAQAQRLVSQSQICVHIIVSMVYKCLSELYLWPKRQAEKQPFKTLESLFHCMFYHKCGSVL